LQYKEPVARFRHHTKPVTGVEWSPWESTTFAASGEDDQVSNFSTF
jgi:ribosome assembly protein RRB1